MNAASRRGLFVLLSFGLLLQGCTGGGSSNSNGSNDNTVTPANKWTLNGVFQFPANETATNLKLVATTDSTRHDTSAYVSDPITLTLTGTPPTATFQFSIDTTRLASPTNFSFELWHDVDGDDIHDISEARRGVDPSPGCTVWCDAGTCNNVAYFQYVTKGNSGTSSTDGSWTINTTGWYYDKGCGNHACAQLVTGPLTGAKLTYDEYNTSAITPAP